MKVGWLSKYGRLWAPSIVIALTYFAVFHRPLVDLQKKELSRFQKLQAAVGRTEDAGSQQLRLDSLSQEAEGLEEQLRSIKESRSLLVSKHNAFKSGLSETIVPAASVADLMRVLERNDIRCISSLPHENSSAQLPTELLPASKAADSKKNEVRSHHPMSLTVVGTFSSLRNALHEIGAEVDGATIASLDMNLPQEEVDWRTWTLTVLVWEGRR